MNKYTIYCTEEQTKKAIELGAPFMGALLPSTWFEEMYPMRCHIYVPENPNGYTLVIPTTEQMIGWLGEQGIHIETEYDLTHKYYDFCILDENKPIGDRTMFNTDFGLPSYKTRKEATLSAIDTVLEYLNMRKERTIKGKLFSTVDRIMMNNDCINC